MPDIGDHAVSEDLQLRFGIRGQYQPALDGMIIPTYDVGRRAIEYQDEVDYFVAGGNVPAVAANNGGFLIVSNLPVDGSRRLIIDRLLIANPTGAANQYFMVVSPGVGVAATRSFKRNVHRQGLTDDLSQPLTGLIANVGGVGTPIGAQISIPAGGSVDLPNFEFLATPVQGSTPIYCIWSVTLNVTFSVTIWGRVVQISK